MYKKIISLLSVFTFVVTMVPSTVFAVANPALIVDGVGLDRASINPANAEVITIDANFEAGNANLANSTGYIRVLKNNVAFNDGIIVEWANGAIPVGPYNWDGMCGAGDLDYCDDAVNYSVEAHVQYVDANAAGGIQEETVESADFAVVTPVSRVSSNKNSFNPLNDIAADNHAVISYTTATNNTRIVIEVKNQAGVLMATLFDAQVAAGAHTIDWNGLAANNVALADGTYSINIKALNGADVIDLAVVNVAQISVIFTITNNPHDFIPVTNQPDDIEFSYQLGVDPTSVSLKIEDLNGNQVAGIQENGDQNHVFQWSGKNGGRYVEPGIYTAILTIGVNGNSTVLEKDFTIRYQNVERPQISNLTVAPLSFDPDTELQTISFTNTRLANIKVEIRNANGLTLRTFDNYKGATDYPANTTHKIEWDGFNTDGNAKLGVGTYKLVVIVNDDNRGVSMEVKDVNINDNGGDIPNSNAHIENISCKPSSGFEPAVDEEMDCEADTKVDGLDVKVFAIRGQEEIELFDEQDIDKDKDSIQFAWNGTDDNDDYVDAGTWRIEFRSDLDGRKLVAAINRTVEYQKPSIDEFLLSKTKIDNDIDEVTYALIKLNDPGEITLNYILDGDEDDEIVEEMEVEKDKWYAIEIDGSGFDYEDDLDIQLTAANEVKIEENTKRKISFDLAEEKVSSTKANLTHDYIYPVVTECNEEMEIGYTLEDPADVVVSIHKGKSGSGSKVIELVNQKDQDAGNYSYTWNCKSENGSKLSNGFYTYKIESKDRSTDTEEGIFVVGEVGGVEGSSKGNDSNNNDDNSEPIFPPVVIANRCAGFTDVDENSQYCAALVWAKSSGVIQGYSDGRFGLFDPINRVELLKVALEASNLGSSATSGNLGYIDVIPGAWYMPYLQRGQELAIFVGDAGRGTARPGDTVNKVESLKITLESLRIATGYQFASTPSRYSDVQASDWFFKYVGESDRYTLYNSVGNGTQFVPGVLVNRGDVVQMLYRLHSAGLL